MSTNLVFVRLIYHRRYQLVLLSILWLLLSGCSDKYCWPFCSGSSSSGVTSNPTTTTSVTVISPNGNENLKTEQFHFINWSKEGVDKVDVDLYKSGVFLLNIRTSDPDTSARFKMNDGVVSAGSEYKIKVTSSTDSTVYDYSDAFFTVRH